MRLRLTLSLLAFVMAGFAHADSTTTTTASTDLGNVMYVGDSITHGINGASWRYSFHKILVDNGISYNAEGYNTGNSSGGVGTTTTYGGVLFNNEHSAQASARAWEIAGRKSGDRFDGTNIKDWLGQSTVKTDGTTTYTGPTFTGDKTPDTFFLLIGTNDLLSDHVNSASEITGAVDQLLTDIGTIVSSMHEANKDAPVYIMTIPAWTTHANNNANDVHEAVAAYNEKLISWGQNQENVYVIDINKGLLDVASSTSFYGCSSMFNSPGSDGLHPNAQGELIIAGNLAKAMGYAGRSVGLERKSGKSLSVQLNESDWALSGVTNSGGTLTFDSTVTTKKTATYTWSDKPSLGYTLDFNVTLGDGSDNGWNTSDNLSVTLGNGYLYGTLNVNEAYIQWGSTVLYSTDMSSLTDSLRVAYVPGDSANGITEGYYVWLDDQLIGEALSAGYASGYNGVTFSYSGSGNVVVSNITLDNTGAYAPSTTGTYSSNALRVDGSEMPVSPENADTGMTEWVNESDYATTYVNNNLTITVDSAVSVASKVTSSCDTVSCDGTGTAIEGTVIASTGDKNVYANNGAYTGDVWVTVAAGGSTSQWYGAQGGSSTLDGNVYLRLTDEVTGCKTVFGIVDSNNKQTTGSVTGNIYLEFDAEDAVYNSFTGTNAASVVGAFANGGSVAVGGDITVVINTGTFNYDVLGGSHSGTNTISGGTNVYINGGTVKGKVVGGGKSGTISGGTSVTVNGGSISGSVSGGGETDTITGGSNLSITGGTIGGAVYGGSCGTGTLTGDTNVTIDGGSFAGVVCGGSNTGSLTGSTNMTINGGSFNTYVFGGSYQTGTVSGDTNLTINGGTFSSLVTGGNYLSTFTATSDDKTEKSQINLTINGGTFNGHIVAAGFGTIDADVNLEITGGNFNSEIYAGTGSSGATLTGTTTVTLKNIDSSNAVGSFTGLLSGGSETGSSNGEHHLVLDGYTAEQVGMQLKEFNDIAVKLSNTTLTNLGGATKVDVSQLSSIRMTDQTASVTTLNLDKTSAVAMEGLKSVALTDSELAGTLNLASSDVTLNAGSQLKDTRVVLGDGGKLVVSANAGTSSTTVTNLADADATLAQSIVSLTGTGTLVNETDLELKSAEDTSFAGTLEGAGTLNLTGAGTQTFVGAGAEDMTVNVAEGGLTLARGTASAIKVGTLTAAKGTTLSLSAENGSSEALVVKEGLDLTGATLNIAYDGTVADYEDSAVFTVEGGNAILDNATIKISNLQAPASTADLSDKIALTIVKFEGTSTASTDTATADTTRLRAARALADSTASTLSAEGASVEIDSDFYNFYFQDFALQTTDNTIELTANVREDNAFDSAADSANSTAGSNLLWDSRALAESGTVLGDAREAVRLAIQSGDASGASRTLAAIVGSTINATGTAQRDALRDQLGTIRNRALALRDEEGTHFWIEGTGAYTNVHTQSDKGGYKLSTWGGTVGADTHLAKNTTVGLALTADYGDLRSQAAERATGDLDSIYVNLFGHYQKGAWGHTLVLTAANNDAKLDRTVDYGAGTYRTHGKTHGYGLGAMYELSYDIALNDRGTSLFQPLFNASVVSTTMRGYDESGAGNAGLKVGEQEWTTATLALGARVSGTFGTKTVGRTFQGEFRANLAQDFGDTQGKTAVGFAGLPTIATQNVYGAKVGSTAFQAAAGINTAVAPTGVIYANVGVEARNGANTVNGSIGYRYSF